MAAVVQGVKFEHDGSLATFTSSEWAERGFCRNCGSHLFYHLKPVDQYFLCVGAFDDSSQFELASEIYIDCKPAGYAFAGNREQLTEAQVIAKYT
jgi:hypothetical protein